MKNIEFIKKFLKGKKYLFFYGELAEPIFIYYLKNGSISEPFFLVQL